MKKKKEEEEEEEDEAAIIAAVQEAEARRHSSWCMAPILDGRTCWSVRGRGAHALARKTLRQLTFPLQWLVNTEEDFGEFEYHLFKIGISYGYLEELPEKGPERALGDKEE